MEPFRPIIDRKIKEMRIEKFEQDEKREIMRLFQNEVEISGKKEILTNAIKIYCRSVFDALNDKDVSLIKFYNYEF